MIINQNVDYNPGFAERKNMLDANGRFSCSIPLSHIFGFCRDVRKVIFGASHNIVLARRHTDDYVLWHGAGVEQGAVQLSKQSLWMPIMTPSLTVEIDCYLLWIKGQITVIMGRYHNSYYN